MDIYMDRNCVYFKNLVDKIIGRNHNLLDNYFNPPDNIKFYSGNKQDEFISQVVRYGMSGVKGVSSSFIKSGA